MITLQTADSILKSVYLDVIVDQINLKTNPFYAAIKKGDENVVGKEVVCPTRYGLNGGIGSCAETGTLPKAASNNYVQLKADLKNIYGTIEISDKALRASESSAGSLVNILNAEMEGLLESAKFNFGRMLYQNGSGELTKIGSLTAQSGKVYPVASVYNVMEGMLVDVVGADGSVKTSGARITAVDRTAKTIEVDKTLNAAEGDILTLQQSYNTELYGLEYLFDESLTDFYGNKRENLKYMLPKVSNANAGASSDLLQTYMDTIEERSGSRCNLIMSSFDARRKYIKNITMKSTNLEYLTLTDGFQCLSFNGVPIVTDRFIEPAAMYFVNTDDFKLQQLCDFKWIEGDNGSVLRQMESRPAYSATLVKYANLICTRPMGQGKLTGLK